MREAHTRESGKAFQYVTDVFLHGNDHGSSVSAEAEGQAGHVGSGLRECHQVAAAPGEVPLHDIADETEVPERRQCDGHLSSFGPSVIH